MQIEKGNKIDYFCSEPFSEQVIKAGANWIGYSDNIEMFLKEYHPTDRHPFFMLMEYMLSYDEVILPDLLNIVKENQYDMIICDSYFGGGCFLKNMVDIPVVSSHSSFAMSKTPVPDRMLVPHFHPQLDYCYQILNRICEKYKLEVPSLEQVFTSKGDLNIVYTTYKFNADEGIHEPDYIFAGPSLDRLQEASDIDFSVINGRKLIYISLGSINTNFEVFFKTCILAFGETDYYVYMSIGKKFDISLLGEIPSNFTVKSFLPQLEILKRADVFITHAGFNSVNEALYFGVPMLTLPQVNDQHMIAKRIAAMQLGITEDMSKLTTDILKDKVKILIEEKNFKENCMNISYEMTNFAKLDQVVCKLEEYVKC